MTLKPPKPGNNASPQDILALANYYEQAAIVLFEHARHLTTPGTHAVAYAPARFCAIHAIELCLNAFLREGGATAGEIKARHHDIHDQEFIAALSIRKKTAEHLRTLVDRREYLVARYGPELCSQQSELNRLTATLKEVLLKTCKHISHTM